MSWIKNSESQEAEIKKSFSLLFLTKIFGKGKEGTDNEENSMKVRRQLTQGNGTMTPSPAQFSAPLRFR